MPRKSSPVIGIEAPVTIVAQEGEQAEGPRRFDVEAYTGVPISVGGYEHPIVVNLEGVEYSNSLIANLDHDKSKRVGHVTERTNDGKTLKLGGLASAKTAARDEVIGSAADGFTWQASIEANPLEEPEFVKKGKTVSVNGQDHTGPIYVANKTKLFGFAFVSHGADDSTTAAIAAERKEEKSTMDPVIQAWAEGMGINCDDLTTEQETAIEANYAGQKAPPKKRLKLDDVVAAQQSERDRQDEITAMAGEQMTNYPEHIEAIRALADTAIDGKWDSERFELELLRASRVQSRPNFGTSSGRNKTTPEVIEAALCISGGMKDLDKRFDEQTLNAADKQFRDGIGLQELFLRAARQNGCDAVKINAGNLRSVLQAAFAPVHGSAFSTLSLPNIISNTANKFLMDGWNAVENVWSRIAARENVNNFFTHSYYSMTGAFEYEKVGATGELKHGEVGEDSYTGSADTYGKMFSVTRQDIINDDLGALTKIPRRIGRGGALKLNDVFWTAFLNNSTFFASGNNNVSTGAGSALDATGAGINAAEIVFRNQTDPDGKPLGVMPAILLAPPTLANTAAGLMGGQPVITGASATYITQIYQGRYRVESSAYMENTSYTGNSTAAWYLLANPEDMPVVVVFFLNGREAPIVESADADFNVLGVQFRGYHDFGVSTAMEEGGVRSAGS